MARLFGALANAGAQANTNRFKRQQYDDQQAAQAREEARRVFEFAALQKDRQEQAAEARKQWELDTTLRAYADGFEDAPDMTKLRGAGIAMDAVTGFRGGATEYTPPEETPYETEVEGRPVRAAKMGSQYLTVGGKVLRNNRQRGANAVAQQEEAKALWDLKMKREVAGQLAADKDERAKERNDADNKTRALVAGIAAASRPQPQEKKDLWTDGKGGYLRLGMDDPIPPGFQPVRSGGSSGATGAAAGSKQQAEALKDLGAQLMAMAGPGGGLRSPTLASRMLKNVADQKDPGIMAAGASAVYGATTGVATQKIDNMRAQLKAILLPMQGGKAITANEERVIIGAFEDVANAPEELREQKMRAMEVAIAPIVARVTGQPDYNQTIAEMRQRAQSYRPKPAGTTTKQAAPPSMQQGETREQRIKRLSGSR